MKNLAKAVIAVMKEVKGIDKSMQIGSGSMSYKGVPDQEVKKIIGDAMAKNGLCILPIGVDAKTKIDRWEETTVYNGVPSTKMKQSVFTESTCKYLLLHESAESIEICGYGQGVDSQDKSAGKSTTYALKYALLYMFLVPTGKIDDADTTHSDDTPIPKSKAPVQIQEPTVDAKVANMAKPDAEITIAQHKEAISKVASATGLVGYYNSLTNPEKANTVIIEAIKTRREELKVVVK